ncbi:MAG: glycerol kinase GlpK [Phycisphaerae bacterium]
MKYVLALDQGTTSSRAILFDHAGSVVGMEQREFPQYFPRAGWVEHDPLEIWESQVAVGRGVMEKCGVGAGEIVGIGISNQRETVVVWDRKTGEPVCNAIVWQDRRTAGFCDELKARGVGEMVQRKTGLVIDAYFSASKVRWVLENVAGVRARAERGELICGTVDSWLIWKLTEGRVHVTDVSNASRTMLYNIHMGAWDEELLGLFGVPRGMLPRVVASSGVVGRTRAFGGEIAIAGVAGDQQAALFGQTCFEKGRAKNTYGTGCFLLMNTGEEAVASKHRLLTTLAWEVGGKKKFAMEGSVFIGGAVVQWLRDGLGIVKSAGEIEGLARSVADSGGVYFVPAFAGLGAPHWDQYARGSIVGLTRGTTGAHLARAALEAIAFQVADVVEVMRADSGVAMKERRVDGGAAANDLMLQFQADLLRVPVVRPKVLETTALGAGYLAGLGVVYWKDEGDIVGNWEVGKRFEPVMGEGEVAERRERWGEALRRAMEWEKRG